MLPEADSAPKDEAAQDWLRQAYECSYSEDTKNSLKKKIIFKNKFLKNCYL